MTRLQFRAPSARRLLWSVVGVALLGGVIAGIVLYANAITTNDDAEPTPIGDYIRLFLLCLTVWGPLLLVTIWQVSVPVIVLIGALAASIRRTGSLPGTAR